MGDEGELSGLPDVWISTVRRVQSEGGSIASWATFDANGGELSKAMFPLQGNPPDHAIVEMLTHHELEAVFHSVVRVDVEPLRILIWNVETGEKWISFPPREGLEGSFSLEEVQQF